MLLARNDITYNSLFYQMTPALQFLIISNDFSITNYLLFCDKPAKTRGCLLATNFKGFAAVTLLHTSYFKSPDL
jgi:hypothetical protein